MLNKLAAGVLNWFPSLRGVVPSTEYVRSGGAYNNSENDYLAWSPYTGSNTVNFIPRDIRKYDATMHLEIKSFEFKFEKGIVSPNIIIPMKEILNQEKYTNSKSKIVLLRCSLHPVGFPNQTSISLDYFINGIKIKNTSNLVRNIDELCYIYKLEEDYKNFVISACGKEKILETIKEYKSNKRTVRTVENEKYLPNHGNVKLYKDTFLCKILYRNRNHEWNKKTLVKLYEIRNQSNYVCFKKEDLKVIKSSLKNEYFDKIKYVDENSLKIQVSKLETSATEGRIKFMLRFEFAIPNEEIHLDQGFQKM